MIRCFRCGSENMDGANFCAKCNFKLPKIDTQIAPQTDVPKGARLAKLRELVHGLIDNEIPLATVREDLEKEIRAFRKGIMAFRKMNLPKPLREEFQEQIDVGSKGMTDFLVSLEAVKTIIPEKDSPGAPFKASPKQAKILQAVLKKATKANELLNECYELSKDSMRRAQDEAYIYEDYQEMMDDEELGF